MIRATLYSDAACPWAYSANPALRVLEWRYGEQLAWRLVMIGLRDEPSSARFDPARVAQRYAIFRDRYGMPFGLTPTGHVGGRRLCQSTVTPLALIGAAHRSISRGMNLARYSGPRRSGATIL